MITLFSLLPPVKKRRGEIGAGETVMSLRVAKVRARGDPVRASIEHIATQKPDLVVLATAGLFGLTRARPSRVSKRKVTTQLFRIAAANWLLA